MTQLDKTPITIWASEGIQWQSTRDRLRDLIRSGAIDFLRNHPHRAHPAPWRDNPWKDGIRVDLDSDDVMDWIVDRIIAAADPHTEVVE